MNKQVLFLTIALTWQLPNTLKAINILAFDCEKNYTKISQISNNEVAPCQKTEKEIMHSEIDLQVIQTRLFNTLHVYHCLILKQSITFHCGYLSHTSMHYISEDVVQITPEACERIHKDRVFSYKSVIFDDLMPNSTTTSSFTEHGHITQDGSCTGQTFQNKRGLFENHHGI